MVISSPQPLRSGSLILHEQSVDCPLPRQVEFVPVTNFPRPTQDSLSPHLCKGLHPVSDVPPGLLVPLGGLDVKTVGALGDWIPSTPGFRSSSRGRTYWRWTSSWIQPPPCFPALPDNFRQQPRAAWMPLFWFGISGDSLLVPPPDIPYPEPGDTSF